MPSERAVATATAVAVIAVLGIGGTVGVPTYVDSNADQMPDQSLYGLEKAGESIKEAAINAGLYGNKADWQVDRWNERLGEFKEMVIENKAPRYMGILKRAQRRLKNACGCADNLRELGRAENVAKWHLEVLRRIKDEVSENALWGVQNAIKNAERYRRGLEKAENKAKRRGPGANVRKIVRRRMGKVREEPVKRSHRP